MNSLRIMCILGPRSLGCESGCKTDTNLRTISSVFDNLLYRYQKVDLSMYLVVDSEYFDSEECVKGMDRERERGRVRRRGVVKRGRGGREV